MPFESRITKPSKSPVFEPPVLVFLKSPFDPESPVSQPAESYVSPTSASTVSPAVVSPVLPVASVFMSSESSRGKLAEPPVSAVPVHVV